MDISISSYLAALSTYLQEKNAIDAALIFQSEKGKIDGLTFRIVA